MPEAEVIKKLRQFRKALERQGIHVHKIILYGSQAKGKVREYSDIDVAVVSGDFGRDRFEEGVRLFEIASAVDARIEPVPISTRAFEKDTWVPLIHEIKSKGIEINI